MSENNIQQTESEVTSDSVNETKEAPKNILLGSISYSNIEDYEKFLVNIDINQALFILISGCTYAQSKGAYSLAEAELISKAISAIKSKNKPAEEKTAE